MFENKQTIEEIKQNMKDAGYTKKEIDAFIPVWLSGNKAESMRLLSKQRKVLLVSIHKKHAAARSGKHFLFQPVKEQLCRF